MKRTPIRLKIISGGLAGLAVLLPLSRTGSKAEPPMLPAAVKEVTAINGLAGSEWKEGKAIVRIMRGPSFYLDEQDEWRPLLVNKVVKAGAVIRTSPESQLDFFLGVNGPFLRLEADSVLFIDQFKFQYGAEEIIITTKLTLAKGMLVARVRKMAPMSQYEITTLKGLVHLREGAYAVCYCGELLVGSGEAAIAVEDKTYTLKDGQYFNPSDNSVNNSE